MANDGCYSALVGACLWIDGATKELGLKCSPVLMFHCKDADDYIRLKRELRSLMGNTTYPIEGRMVNDSTEIVLISGVKIRITCDQRYATRDGPISLIEGMRGGKIIET